MIQVTRYLSLTEKTSFLVRKHRYRTQYLSTVLDDLEASAEVKPKKNTD